MKRKMALIIFSLVLTGLVCSTNFQTFAAKAPTTLTFAHIYDPGGLAIYDGANMIAQDFEKVTKGRYKIKVVPSGALGTMKTNIEGLSLGSIDITIAGNSYLSDAYPPITLGAAPYAIRGWDHIKKYFKSKLHQKFKNEYTKITGIQILGAFSVGARQVTSNRPIRKPADMKGLKIRVPDAPMFLAMPKAVGANPTPVNYAEVYLAIQQGIVDAEENSLVTIYNMKFYEVQKYINLTQHMMEPVYLVVSPHTWKKLSVADRKHLAEVIEKGGDYITEANRQEEQALIKKFKELGNVIVTDVDVKAFRKACEPFNLSSDRPWKPQQYRELQAIK
jgi:tripartite ATP-independent transporter DctP family solute receptor